MVQVRGCDLEGKASNRQDKEDFGTDLGGCKCGSMVVVEERLQYVLRRKVSCIGSFG